MARPALTVALSLLVLALLLSVVPRGAHARDVSVDAGGHVADAFDDAGDAFDEYDDGEEGGYDDDGDMGGFDDGSHFHDDGDAHGDEEDEFDGEEPPPPFDASAFDGDAFGGRQ